MTCPRWPTGPGRAETDTVVLNAGSTSLKAACFAGGDPGAEIWSHTWPAAELVVSREGADSGSSVSDGDRVAGIEAVLRAAPVRWADVGAVGHRIVHGAGRFTAPVVVDAGIEDAIASLAGLAPLHNRAGLDGIAAARRLVPAALQVAVFDTAFHHTLPPAAFAYGGPRAWLDQGLRRFGFHGISHQHATAAAARLLGRPVEDLALVSCHLGGGCSLAAVHGGRSVDTTMGLTPLDGLVMGTRCGSLDPALVLHLIRTGHSPDEVEQVLEHGSGLLGLSGVSADLRQVVAARDGGDADAGLAVDVFVHRVATGVGAMAAALGRLDAVVFTGGIGQHSAEVRARVADRLGPFGLRLDPVANEAGRADSLLSPADAPVAALVVTAREEAAIARAVNELLTPP